MAAPLSEIDTGWDFKVLVLDGEWVLRLPRDEAGAVKLEKEAALIPALAPALPVALPQFEQVSRDPPFVVYRLIPGEPLRDEDPDGVRAFLEALHSFDAGGLGLPRPDWRETYRGHAESWRRDVVPLLDRGERPRAEALLGEIETLTGFTPALVHCDLGSEHLLVRDGRLVAVLDWGDAKIGDPAIDYAMLLNGPFPDWEVDAELRRRARIYFQLVAWFEVLHGLRIEDRNWVRRGLEGVRSRL